MRRVSVGGAAEGRDLIHLMRMLKRAKLNDERPRADNQKLVECYSTAILMLQKEQLESACDAAQMRPVAKASHGKKQAPVRRKAA